MIRVPQSDNFEVIWVTGILGYCKGQRLGAFGTEPRPEHESVKMTNLLDQARFFSAAGLSMMNGTRRYQHRQRSC